MDNHRVMYKDFEAYKRLCVSWAFPGEVNFDDRAIGVERYKNHVRLLKAGSADKYPKNFFSSETTSIDNLRFIMEYLLDTLRGNEPEELYDFFADHNQAKDWLQKKIRVRPGNADKDIPYGTASVS